MTKYAAALAMLALIACGGQEASAPEPTQGAEASGTEAVGGTAPDVAGAPFEAAAPAEIQSCLELVQEGRFSDAVPVCLRAVEQNPESAEAKAALEEAQQQAAGASAEEAGSEALGEAESEPR
jgi:hypothetical protein